MAQTDMTDQLMTYAVMIANHAHKLSNKPDDYASFVGGVNNRWVITNKCLIIEEYYGVLMYILHTPLGSWEICSLNNPREPEIRQQMFQYLGLEMICPGFQVPNYGHIGPYWLVTSVNGHPIPHPDVKLLPAHAPIEPRRLEDGWYHEVQPELVDLYHTYRAQMTYFIIDEPAADIRDVLDRQFDTYLAQWIRSGLIGGTPLPRLLDASDADYHTELERLLEPFSENERWFITKSDRVRTIFRLICKLGEQSEAPAP
jgi:hypothetical protein